MSSLRPRLKGELGIVWGQFAARRVNRLALYATVTLVVIAICSDMIASELPIYLRYGGHTYWLPNLFVPADLRIYDNQMLRGTMKPPRKSRVLWSSPLSTGPRAAN